MPTIEETVAGIVEAATMDERVARIRLIPQHHGTGHHPAIYTAIARQAYVSHLAPDFAYVHEAPFFELPYFLEVYSVATSATENFTNISAVHLARVLRDDPRTLLVFRTVVGLTRNEFAHSRKLAGGALDLRGLSGSKVDSMERSGTSITDDQARVVAETISQIMAGALFGDHQATRNASRTNRIRRRAGALSNGSPVKACRTPSCFTNVTTEAPSGKFSIPRRRSAAI